MPSQTEITTYYRQWSPAIFSACFRILNTREDAEECMQDAFLKLYTGNMHFYSDAATFSWLKKTAVYGAIDRLRWRNGRQTDSFEVLAAKELYKIENEDVANQYNINVIYSDEEKVARIKAAMAQLPALQRVVMGLYWFEGYDYKEIEQITGLNNTHIRTLASRAKKRIHDMIKAE